MPSDAWLGPVLSIWSGLPAPEGVSPELLVQSSVSSLLWSQSPVEVEEASKLSEYGNVEIVFSQRFKVVNFTDSENDETEQIAQSIEVPS